LKNGVTFNGHLVECDNFMNVTLREVYQTSADGEKFWKMKEMYIKGNVVSLLSSLDRKVLMGFWIVRWRSRRKQGQQVEIKAVRGVRLSCSQLN
jgi:hypothetical protein